MALISAPAGFGKTTLISAWVADLQRPVAWLSLDERDNDPTRFLRYLVAALQTIAQDVGVESLGEGALNAFQSPQPTPPESILTALLNEVATAPASFVLVLDDYHVIESQAVGDALAFLLEHLPPQMHLVITTREDPPLPLARYRVRAQLTEVRARDLRFTPDEAATFLNESMGLHLSANDVTALERRTEGWIAGLQLAALALQGTLATPEQGSASGFIRAFAGDNRYIVDYLAEEVLQRQPQQIHNFLLQTAILEQLSGPLCDAVTGQAEGNQLLPELERSNLFVVPLDEKRRWYRYHHLFADVLYAHLREEQPEHIATLHLRASQWYEENEQPADAIRHALAAEDFERAAGLVELVWSAMDRNLESATWLGWVQALPSDRIRVRPVLCVGYAWALLNGGELEASEAWLRAAEHWLEMMDHGDESREDALSPMVVTDAETFQSLPASVASARAFLAQAQGDASGCVVYAQRALDLLPEDDQLGRAVPYGVLGLAYWGLGELEAAHQAMSESMARFRVTDNLVAAISATYGLADIRITQGRLRDAVGAYEQSLQLVAEHGGPAPRGTADLYLGLSDLSREQGDLNVAKAHLRQCEDLGESAALPNIPSRLCIIQARLQETEGNLDAALELLERAERLYFPTPVPDTRPIAALKTRVWIAQGRLVEAQEWTRARDLSVDDELSYLREFEHVTLARVLMADPSDGGTESAMHAAMGLLERLLTAAEAGDRRGSMIEILLLQALAHRAQGDTSRALAPLERALALAEPEGYVRIFVDEGAPMAALLREAAKEGIAPSYVRHLLAAFGPADERTPVVQNLVEPLSERELDVLRLLRTELSGPQIARKLVVSLNTMRTHTKNIYSKLEVNNRRAAVRRAEELELF